MVRNGGTLLAEHAETEKNPFWEMFAQSSAAMAMPTAQAIVGLLGEHLAKKPKAGLPLGAPNNMKVSFRRAVGSG